jgi:hypothetical protein
VKLVNCYHTPCLIVSLYSLRQHRRSLGCAFIGDHQGMYLTVGKIYTRVHDDIDCCIQLHPLIPHPNLRYDINYTTESVVSNFTMPIASPSKAQTPPIPPTSLTNPVTYHGPTLNRPPFPQVYLQLIVSSPQYSNHFFHRSQAPKISQSLGLQLFTASPIMMSTAILNFATSKTIPPSTNTVPASD